MDSLIILVGLAAVLAVGVVIKAIFFDGTSKNAKITAVTLLLCFATAVAAAVFMYLGPGTLVAEDPQSSMSQVNPSSVSSKTEETQAKEPKPLTISERIKNVKEQIKKAEKDYGTKSEKVHELKIQLSNLENIQKYGNPKSYGEKPKPSTNKQYNYGSSGGSGGGSTKYQNNYTENTQETYKEQNATYVLVTRTGSKYHLRKCGNGTYYQATLDDALARGLDPCSKCF